MRKVKLHLSKLLIFPCVLFVAVVANGIRSLRIYSLEVPELAWTGDSVTFHCNYQVDPGIEYTVNWFKDDVEFFRYIPNDFPAGQFFPLRGVKVDLKKSFNGTLRILHVNKATSGSYRCEVTIMQDKFQSVSAEKTMKVFDVPGRNYGNTMNKGYRKDVELFGLQIASFALLAVLSYWRSINR